MNESPPHALSSVSSIDCEVMKITPPPIVPTQNGSYEVRSIPSYETHVRITFKIKRDARSRVRFIQPYAFGVSPKSLNFVEISQGHRLEGILHAVN